MYSTAILYVRTGPIIYMCTVRLLYIIIYVQYAYYINTAITIIYEQHGYYVCTVRLLCMCSAAIIHVRYGYCICAVLYGYYTCMYRPKPGFVAGFLTARTASSA